MTITNEHFKVGRVMIVDDERELMNALCEALTVQGYETEGFTAGADALKALADQDYDLLLTDMMMPEMDGIVLLKAGLKIDPNLVGIIMTGHGTVQTAVEAIKLGAFDYMLKPFQLATLLPLLSRAMEVRHLRMENMQLHETVAIHELGKAIAFSTDLSDILSKVADAALQQCDADEVSIMLPTRDRKELYVAVVRGGHTDYIGERLPLDQGIAGWVARNREPVVLNGGVDDQRFSPIKPRADIRAAISMPMLAGGDLVGVLNVNITRAGHRHFTLGQVKTLSILVSIIAPILENSRLYIQVRQAEEKYRTIFENAIEGIFQSAPEGQIITANPAMATMLGYDSPEDLVSAWLTDVSHQLYVDPEERTTLMQMIKTYGQAEKYETRFYRKDGSIIWVSFNIQAVRDEKGGLLHYEGMTEDITERKRIEKQQVLSNKILQTLNRPNEIINLIRDILLLLKEHTGIEAIAIRLQEGDDFPYYETKGFPDHFLEAENSLCARDAAGEIVRDSKGNPYLEGWCGNVLCGRTDPSRPFFTEGGSFWTNSTTEQLVSTSEEDRHACTRNRCNNGYESVALIPLRSGGETIGLLQLNDARRDSFTIQIIRFLEGIGASIGIAVTRLQSVERLRESEEKYRLHFENAIDIIFSLDADLRLLSISPSVERTLGYKPEELVGKAVSELNITTPSSLEKAASDIKRVLAGEWVEATLYEYRAKDGTKRFGEVNASPLFHDGRVVAAVCVSRDITERKETEEWLIRERGMVDRIMKTSPAGIIVMGHKGQIVFANKRAEEILGLTQNEITRQIHDAPEWHITDFDGNCIPHEQLPFQQVMTTDNPVYGVRHAIEFSDRRRVFLSINGAPIHDEQGNVSEVILTIDDVTQYRQVEEKIEQSLKKLQRSMNDTIKVISMIVETRDPYTAGHQRKVSKLAVAIAKAKELHLSEEQIGGIQTAGSIHDLGKISVPAGILSKPGRLSDIEFRLIKVHPESGYEILKDIEFSMPVAEIVLQHHERMDGSGYPKGLKGEEILMEARIIAIADVVDAMASHRPYRTALGIDAALEEIEKNKGSLYDVAVVESCLKLFKEKGYQLE